jgi:hypothetical protein
VRRLHLRWRAAAIAPVALLVGTLLNLINQGDILIRGESPELAKLVLTYVIPYAVATYGAVSYRLRRGAVRPE